MLPRLVTSADIARPSRRLELCAGLGEFRAECCDFKISSVSGVLEASAVFSRWRVPAARERPVLRNLASPACSTPAMWTCLRPCSKRRNARRRVTADARDFVTSSFTHDLVQSSRDCPNFSNAATAAQRVQALLFGPHDPCGNCESRTSPSSSAMRAARCAFCAEISASSR